MKPFKRLISNVNDASDLDELDLKAIVQRKVDFFKDHTENKVFDSLKDKTYWRNLKRDIQEAKGIENPVICFPDGTLIEGHSRIEVLRQLINEGKIPKDYNVPTIIFKGSKEDGSKRLILGNLNRFEIDANTRTLLFAKVYPGYFAPQEVGAHGEPPPTRKEVSEEMGTSESQTKREKALVQEAIKETGKTIDELKPDDLQKQRDKKNEKRKTTRKPKQAITAPTKTKAGTERENAYKTILEALEGNKKAIKLLEKYW